MKRNNSMFDDSIVLLHGLIQMDDMIIEDGLDGLDELEENAQDTIKKLDVDRSEKQYEYEASAKSTGFVIHHPKPVHSHLRPVNVRSVSAISVIACRSNLNSPLSPPQFARLDSLAASPCLAPTNGNSICDDYGFIACSPQPDSMNPLEQQPTPSQVCPLREILGNKKKQQMHDEKYMEKPTSSGKSTMQDLARYCADAERFWKAVRRQRSSSPPTLAFAMHHSLNRPKCAEDLHHPRNAHLDGILPPRRSYECRKSVYHCGICRKKVRSALWMEYGGATCYLEDFGGRLAFRTIAANLSEDELSQFDQDILVTFQDNIYFRQSFHLRTPSPGPQSRIGLEGGQYQNSRVYNVPLLYQPLRVVLAVFNRLSRRVPYCQPICTLAATFLLVQRGNAEYAFGLLWVYTHVLVPGATVYEEAPMGATHGFLGDLVMETLRIRDPALFEHLDNVGIPVRTLFNPWMFNAFIGTLPFKTALRVLDCIFYDAGGAFRVAQLMKRIDSIGEHSIKDEQRDRQEETCYCGLEILVNFAVEILCVISSELQEVSDPCALTCHIRQLPHNLHVFLNLDGDALAAGNYEIDLMCSNWENCPVKKTECRSSKTYTGLAEQVFHSVWIHSKLASSHKLSPKEGNRCLLIERFESMEDEDGPVDDIHDFRILTEIEQEDTCYVMQDVYKRVLYDWDAQRSIRRFSQVPYRC